MSLCVGGGGHCHREMLEIQSLQLTSFPQIILMLPMKVQCPQLAFLNTKAAF